MSLDMATTVKCPHCGNKFSPEVALEHDIRVQLEKEFASKMHEQHIAFEERERTLRQREEKADIEMRRRLLEREKLLKEEAERTAREKASVELREKQLELDREKERLNILHKKHVTDSVEKARIEERMKLAEAQKKLDDQAKLINEMKRRAEQGSMQAQGEVQELALEDYLKHAFVRDQVEEVAKGKRGGDCVHHVKDAYGNLCGKILYESKRTKTFSNEWTSKLKEDMRLTQADVGVIVTEALPADMTHFGLRDGVWVCTFTEFKALATLFRESLCRVGEVRIAQENKGDKMQMLYNYLTSIEFRQRIEAIVESFQQMQDDLGKEKMQTYSRWARREKQILQVIENTAGLYGDVRGIAGNAVKEIDALESDQINLIV
ncbi:MAG TPA: DUF2130 domain-containing protein [Cyclobacteriaceae bacterium]|nr:DUF2130 domain-containing protein [Cyclobacteriaceae bacterium]